MNPTAILLRRAAGASGGPASDPFFSNVVSLLHFNGVNGGSVFTDVKGKTWAATGDCITSIVQSKFGGASLRIDGTGDFLDCTHADMAFGTGDFTVEMWIMWNAITTNPILVDTRFGGASGSYALYDNNATAGVANVTLFANSADRAASSAMSTLVWYHVALSRVSGSSRLFVDGVQQGSTYADTNNYNSTQFRLGHAFSATSSSVGGFNGWVDEMRITKGVGRYTANFTPPSAAFPDS